MLGASYTDTNGRVPASPGASSPTPTATTGYPTLPPVPPGLSPSTLPNGTSTKPKLVMGQLAGDGYTVYVVYGSGFVPLTQVQVHLIGHGVASFRPTVDQKGTFNYAIDQGRLFFSGAIPAGTYHVLVTGARGRRATATFQVHPPAPPPVAGPSSSGRSPQGA